jgi:hypothetical protein
MTSQFGNNKVTSGMQPCPLHKDQPEGPHSIEIQLVGEDNLPIPWEEYLIVLPGGRKLRGVLDDKGKARLKGLAETGTAKISFVNLDQDAWELIGSSQLEQQF